MTAVPLYSTSTPDAPPDETASDEPTRVGAMSAATVAAMMQAADEAEGPPASTARRKPRVNAEARPRSFERAAARESIPLAIVRLTDDEDDPERTVLHDLLPEPERLADLLAVVAVSSPPPLGVDPRATADDAESFVGSTVDGGAFPLVTPTPTRISNRQLSLELAIGLTAFAAVVVPTLYVLFR